MEKETTADATVATTEPKGSELQTKQVPEETAEQKLAKAEQQAQQERANARKARERLQQAESQLEQYQERTGQLEGRLGELEGKLKEELTKKQFSDLANLDPDTTDVPQLVNAYQGLVRKVQEQGVRMVAQEKFIGSLHAQSQQSQSAAQQQQTVNRILSKCDAEFGAQFRNEATKLADEWTDSGDEPQPTQPLDGYWLMQKAYAEVKRRHEAKEAQQKKTTVPTDTGLRGPASHVDLGQDEFKPGSLDEVAEDLRRKMKAGTWKKAFR